MRPSILKHSVAIAKANLSPPRINHGLKRPISVIAPYRRTNRYNAAPPHGLQTLELALTSSSPGLVPGALANSLVYLVGIKILLRGLTPVGVASSWVLGTLSWAAFGPGAYSIVCLYFIIGSLVTKVKLEQKQKEGTAEARSGRRSLGSVFGSGIAGIVCSLLALLTGNPDFWRIGFVASFVSKLADTVSSEIGKAYGTKTYLVTSFQQVPRGTEGAVSLEGTGAGILGAVGLSAVGIVLGQVTLIDAVWVVVAAIVANYLESVLGATVQGTAKVQWLTNDIVNGLQISLAATIALGLHHFTGG